MNTKGLFALLVLALLLSLFKSNAQVQTFVPMDESMQQLLDFYHTDTIIVVVPNGYEVKEKDKKLIESFTFWRDNLVYIYLQESILEAVDQKKHLQYFGPACMFETAILTDTPFKAEKNGFSYRGREFKSPDDSFYYMNSSASRIYTCRNGEDYPLAYTEYLAGGVYQLYIFSGNSITLSGFDKNDDSVSDINDMEALRSAYFCQKVISQFFDLYFACEHTDIYVDSLASQLDRFVADLCHFLEVETMGIPRITTYIYASREDLQSFLAANSSQTIYGKSFGNINHIMHFDLAIFKHEAGHSIINSKVGENPHPFINEGFRQYTDYLFNREAYENDLKILRENVHLLTPELILSTHDTFFTSMTNYSISGVFMKYLVDNIGLDEFKTAYAQNNLIETIEDRMGSLERVIDDFKLQLRTTNCLARRTEDPGLIPAGYRGKEYKLTLIQN